MEKLRNRNEKSLETKANKLRNKRKKKLRNRNENV